MKRLIASTLGLALVAAACGSGDDESVETTRLSLPETTFTVATTARTTSTTSAATSTEDSDATTAATVVFGVPSYQVLDVAAGEDAESIVVLVEPGDYSNVQLENLVFDIVDRFAPAAAIVVDDSAAAQLLGMDELTDADRDFLAAHTLLMIENGVEVTFLGPYTDVPGITVGS